MDLIKKWLHERELRALVSEKILTESRMENVKAEIRLLKAKIQAYELLLKKIDRDLKKLENKMLDTQR